MSSIGQLSKQVQFLKKHFIEELCAWLEFQFWRISKHTRYLVKLKFRKSYKQTNMMNKKKLNASCIYLKHNIYLSNSPMNKAFKFRQTFSSKLDQHVFVFFEKGIGDWRWTLIMKPSEAWVGWWFLFRSRRRIPTRPESSSPLLKAHWSIDEAGDIMGFWGQQMHST